MRVAALVLAGGEAAPHNGADSDGIKVVCRDNATGRGFGALADTERGTGDFAENECINQRAVPLQVEEVRPGNRRAFRTIAGGPPKSEQAILMGYERVRAKKNALQPTEYCGIG